MVGNEDFSQILKKKYLKSMQRVKKVFSFSPDLENLTWLIMLCWGNFEQTLKMGGVHFSSHLDL